MRRTAWIVSLCALLLLGLADIALGSGGSPVVVLLFFGGFAIFMIYLAVHSARYRRRVRERDERVRTASAEAADDDAYFGADYLVPYARSVFLEAQ